MKKIIMLLLLVSFISGCATYNKSLRTYSLSYEYDLLYSSALNTLVDNKYTIIDHNKDEGVIHAINYSDVYSSVAIGMFGILPWFYSRVDFPTMTIVLTKVKDRTYIKIGETTSTSLNDNAIFINDSIIDQYNLLKGTRSELKKTTESVALLSGNKEIFDYKWYRGSMMSDKVLELTNNDNATLENIMVMLTFSYSGVHSVKIDEMLPYKKYTLLETDFENLPKETDPIGITVVFTKKGEKFTVKLY